ncbi:MAG: hypothetical protein HY245_11990 [Rhizobiales bacterium]|nr:hypothetical protein [Hyphomicrobiales bacterium]MBI3674108.1 hypothetical protein [Hyphomicrobiales bacterium]
MSVELLGFVAGAAVACCVGLVLMRHERWKEIATAYRGRPEASRKPHGNALIWPSR